MPSLNEIRSQFLEYFRNKDHAIVAMSARGDDRRPGKGRGAQRSSPGKQQRQLIWQHGDRVRVRAERIDPMRRRVEFALAADQ